MLIQYLRCWDSTPRPLGHESPPITTELVYIVLRGRDAHARPGCVMIFSTCFKFPTKSFSYLTFIAFEHSESRAPTED